MRKTCRVLLPFVLLLGCVVAAEGGGQPQRRALLVGVHAYREGKPRTDLTDLNCVPDVEALRRVLVDKFGFDKPTDEIRVLQTKEETTHEAIVKTFRSFLIDQTKPGDIAFFHYSGHGSRIPDTHKPPRKLSGYHQCLVPSDATSFFDTSKVITDDEFRDLLAELRAKHPANLTLSFDCCFSGTVTRGGRMMVRGRDWTGPPPKASLSRGQGTEEAGAGGLLLRGEASAEDYVVITATRNNQLAHETDDDQGNPMGLLSYALVKALCEATPRTTYRDLFDRVSSLMCQRQVGQNPTLEGDLDKVLFEGTVLPPQPYIDVKADANNLTLKAGFLQGMTAGSRFALYREGTKDFASDRPLAEAIIVKADATTSSLEFTPEYAGKVTLEQLALARAVEREHKYGAGELMVATAGLNESVHADDIMARLRDLPLVKAEPTDKGRWDVRISLVAAKGVRGDQQRQVKLERSDGSVIASIDDSEAAPRAVRDALSREARWRLFKRIENPGQASDLHVELRLVPVDVRVDAQGRATYVRDRKLARADGQIVLNEGNYVMLELRNTGTREAFVTVIDLRADGTVGPLWPHPDVRVQDNKIPPDDQWHRVPAPFVFRLEKPYGQEVFRAIATSEPADFSPLLDRAALEEGAPRGETRGAREAVSPLGQLLMAATLGQRGAALAGVRPSDWSTSDVLFQIVPKH